jgi:succinate-semialdehyde dehydrogenase/glutarate-semialdehyde dehydrogenase
MPCRSVSPATGEVLKVFTEHTNEQILAALDAADKAFHTWSETPIAERSKIMSPLRSVHELPDRYMAPLD